MTANTSHTPDDFTLTYEYRAGSMPPPYHDEYTVTIGPGLQGQIVYSAGYPDASTPTYTEPLTVDQKQLDHLYSLVLKHDMLRAHWRTSHTPIIGGSVRWATFAANGTSYSVPADTTLHSPSDPNAVYTYIIDHIVSKSLWTVFEQHREEYQQSYKKAHNSP